MNETIYTASTTVRTLYEGGSLSLALSAAKTHALGRREKTYVQETKPGDAPRYVWTSSSLFRR
jgi:hypothetical protein